MTRARILAGLALSALFAGQAAAADKLTLYCSAQEDWCQVMARGFEEATGIKVNMTRKSSGETFAQVKAEASNPKGDVWWGGTGDPHLQAAEEGLTEPYESPMRGELNGWAISQAKSAGDKTIGIYSGALGYGYNEDILKKNNLPVPACWKDLLKPEYKGHVQMANPNSSALDSCFRPNPRTVMSVALIPKPATSLPVITAKNRPMTTPRPNARR